MKRLLEMLRQVRRGSGSSIGFATSRTIARQSVVLLADFKKPDLDAVGMAIQQGVEAFVFPAELLIKDPTLTERLSQLPKDPVWGVRGSPSQTEINRLGAVGCDFLIISPAGPLRALRNGVLGPVIELEAGAPEYLLRSLDRMPVDIMLFQSPGASTGSIDGLASLWRATSFFRKPLVLGLPACPDLDDLSLWREGGADGFLVPVGAEGDQSWLGKLKRAVSCLPAGSMPKHRVDVSLPQENEVPPVLPPDDLE